MRRRIFAPPDMRFRALGRTGLQVSEISLGTVSLGSDYGLCAPGEFGRPDRREALGVIQSAADKGINLFDTAPTYGDAERLLGEALTERDGCFVATKVSFSSGCASDKSASDHIMACLERSLAALKRDALDIVQIHNATVEALRVGEILEILAGAKNAGKVRFIGASVYTDEEALAAIETNVVDVIQIAYSILDQRKGKTVLPAAHQHNVGVLVRSALLKGVLSSKVDHLPDELKELKDAAERARQKLNVSWNELPMAALRFCLDSTGIASVLVGPRTEAELNQSLSVLEMPPFGKDFLNEVTGLGLTEERLLNPSLWPIK
jgi:aryl-alcohol dehydrogenase-like predicted oxidoreductase